MKVSIKYPENVQNSNSQLFTMKPQAELEIGSRPTDCKLRLMSAAMLQTVCGTQSISDEP
jgi:hypothetical protein